MKIEIRKGETVARLHVNEKLEPKLIAKVFASQLKDVLEYVFKEECEVQVTFEEIEKEVKK